MEPAPLGDRAFITGSWLVIDRGYRHKWDIPAERHSFEIPSIRSAGAFTWPPKGRTGWAPIRRVRPFIGEGSFHAQPP
jgi:hypothetical protein